MNKVVLVKKCFLVVLLIVFGIMCGCVKSEPEGIAQQEQINNQSTENVLYEKYKDIISLLESEDYTGAIETIQSMEPVPDVVTEEVEINMDNWEDYFEIVEEVDEQKSADGSIIIQKVIWYVPKVKDQFKISSNEELESKVLFGVESLSKMNLYETKPENIDYENMTIIDAKKAKKLQKEMEEKRSETTEYPLATLYFDQFVYSVNDGTAWFDVTSDYNLVRVEGKLYLEK